MLVSDGVLPSNEGRGYVLRRVIRRAVVRAQRLGVTGDVTPRLVETVASVSGRCLPVGSGGARHGAADRRRARRSQFLRTLHSGSAILEEELDRSPEVLPGDVAFRLHDTHGFPIDLTVEMAAERGVPVDIEGFEREMAAQRERARSDAARRKHAAGDESTYRELLDASGPTRFTGYEHFEQPAVVVGVLETREPGRSRGHPRQDALLCRVRRTVGRHRGDHHRDRTRDRVTTRRVPSSG